MIGAILTFIFLPFLLWLAFRISRNFFDSIEDSVFKACRRASGGIAGAIPESIPQASPDVIAYAQAELSRISAEAAVLRCRLDESIKNHNTEETLRISDEIDALSIRLNAVNQLA